MKVTYYGHSCFSVAIGGKQLLFDPFIRPNNLASHIDVDSIRPDYILISHGHFDHVADTLEIAQNSHALLISNFEIVTWFSGKGYNNVHGMNTGGKKAFEWGTVKFTPAFHSSGLPDNTYGGSPVGFVIESAEGNFYYSGDTALTVEMELIGRMHKLDFAIVPIGDNFTMGIEDAVMCAEMINCNDVIGVHYDSFPPIAIDKIEAVEKFAEAGKTLTLINIGESVDMPVSVHHPVY